MSGLDLFWTGITTSGPPELSTDYGLVAILQLLLMATEHIPLHIIQERILVIVKLL